MTLHDAPLLSVSGLTKHFPGRRGSVRAVDGLDFEVLAGKTLGLVGESGCGKSTTARLLARLLEPTAGSIRYDGHDISHLSARELRPFRSKIQMVFQDPYASLNPRQTIGTIVGSALEVNNVGTHQWRTHRAQELLEMVGLNPEHHHRYPHEFSGGQRQRVGIARALSSAPRLIIADEPVSSLDVSIQAQVLNLLKQLQVELGLTFVLISHDLAVVRHMSDTVAVMYAGKIVELADRESLYSRPRHPYTKALLSAVPEVGASARVRLRLDGEVPSSAAWQSGCSFRPRCPVAEPLCGQEPPLQQVVGARARARHQCACHVAMP